MTEGTRPWRCRSCGFNHWHKVTVLKKNNVRYETSFYACSQCTVMFLDPQQYNSYSDAAPNIAIPNVLPLRATR